MEASSEDGVGVLQIAGFWRRLGAFVADLILLGLVGFILGTLLFDSLARMGSYARLIGFAIALAYFGVCNSRIRGGQTLGKQWLRLRVVDRNGQALSLPRSLLRYTVLGLPFFLNGLPLDPRIPSWLGYLLALVVFGGASAIIYLYVFNRRTRQSLHDLIVGSYVVQVKSAAQEARFPALWRGHLAVVAALALIALGLPALMSRLWEAGDSRDLLPLLKALSHQPHAMSVQIERGWTQSGEKESHYLQSQLWLDRPMIEDAVLAKGIAQQMAKADADLAKEDAIVVTLVYGYDMVIASGWQKHTHSFKPDELQ